MIIYPSKFNNVSLVLRSGIIQHLK